MPHNFFSLLHAKEYLLARKHGVTIDAMLQRGYRDKRCIAARWELWHYARYNLGSTYYRLERIYGYDHTTIQHGIRRYNSNH